jgi:hypothetical protein
MIQTTKGKEILLYKIREDMGNKEGRECNEIVQIHSI